MKALAHILEHKIIAIIRGANPEDVLAISRALKDGGVSILEITLNSPKALSTIEKVADEFGDEVLVGAGTVLDAESARAALLSGAKFILSPTVNRQTIEMTKRYGAVSIPGALTPTEILTAYEHGADIIKVFPANAVGVSYIKDIHGPLPHIPLMPTGGVDLTNIGGYFRAGAVAAGLGSSLVNAKHQVTESYLNDLTEKAAAFVAEVSKSLS
ncbi:bifunctional 4-hydroxy-2-oxoglutarate aldolase/2-dehydro-3-deoxy-phosphogluconate aldolase [Fictibacillus gelatini]|uniref:bifunctional 4-hydroxy-2-oxoglutarate aldolase/2-dehydro-3-deoxy-phosphogluconate aldolase n=1 Tax=Fictibacillus gelatini TaxID=225985 RepID=UPI000427668E|nr:bifunctional 4-hydroxy-2-oxoglutarate aldolase/2-dehydro-3-deoxy-phosphogluconate aldolase [Fictibacillus gelatini]